MDREPASIEVRAISGQLVALLAVTSPDETVGSLRHRLLKSLTDDAKRHAYGQSHFVHGCSVLADHEILRDCLSPGTVDCPVPVLVIVCRRPSSLAEHLSRTEMEAGGLVDVVDGIFQTQHILSMRHRPRAEDVTTNFNATLRGQIVNWLAASCHAMRFDDQLLHGAVLTLDRYSASLAKPIADAELLSVSLAALCTEMKLATHDEFPYGCWQRSLLHLGQGRVGLQQILAAEMEILRRLGFNVWIPNTLTFLQGLGLRLSQGVAVRQRNGRPGLASPISALQMALAQILSEVALCDPDFQYAYPPVAIAAGALGLALLSTCSEACARPNALEYQLDLHELLTLHDTLLEDVASYCPLLNAFAVVRECEHHLLKLWQECFQGQSQWSEYYSKACERHKLMLRCGVDLDMLCAVLQYPPPDAAFARFRDLDA